jgi:serine/threonine-protein kinase
VASVVDELSGLLGVAGWSLLWAAFSWLAYLSFEPYVRRLWPRTLISWTRMLTGRLQDSLVGRDVLVGTLAGITTVGILLVQISISGQHPVPVFRQSAVDALTSTAWSGAAMTVAVLDGIQFTVAGIVTFVLLRILLRRVWIAAAVLCVLSIPFSPTGISTITDAIVTVIIVAFHLTIVVRFGLLATAVTFVVTRLLTWLPLTLNAEAWYFGQSLLVLLTIFGLATYGFFAALGGRPAFGEIKAALK